MTLASSTFCTASFRSGRVVQRDVPEFLQRHQLVAEIERPADIELLDRRPVVEQHQKLDLGGPQIHHRRFKVGFELRALQLQPVQIHLRQVAGLEARAIHLQFPIPVRQVLLRVLSTALACSVCTKAFRRLNMQIALLIQYRSMLRCRSVFLAASSRNSRLCCRSCR